MATSYTVVLFSRQHFGNQGGTFDDIEPGVAFVGGAKDFLFDCPGINAAEPAFLMFQSRDVDHQRNVLRVNGEDVARGTPCRRGRFSVAPRELRSGLTIALSRTCRGRT